MLPIFLFSWLSFLHPFFVSVTEMRQNEKSKSLEISCRIFYTDLETALEKNNKVQLDILKPANRKQLEIYISEYLKKHVQLQADGKPLVVNYVGFEIEEDAAWCYLEIANMPKVKKLEITNDILFAEHPTQTNLVHVIMNGDRQSTKLDNPDSKYIFSF